VVPLAQYPFSPAATNTSDINLRAENLVLTTSRVLATFADLNPLKYPITVVVGTTTS
jgi:hypothetical protein